MTTEQTDAINPELLSDNDIDVIGEILNMSMGSGATALSAMLDKQVTITTPKLKQSRFGDMDYSDMDPSLMVKINYVEGIVGANVIMFRSRDMQTILNLMMGNEDALAQDADIEFDEMTMSAACEVMNQMMGSSATALSDVLGRVVNISTPTAHVSSAGSKLALDLMELSEDAMVACVSFDLMVEDIMASNFISFLSMPLARDIISSVMPSDGIGIQPPSSTPASAPAAQQEPPRQTTAPAPVYEPEPELPPMPQTPPPIQAPPPVMQQEPPRQTPTPAPVYEPEPELPPTPPMQAPPVMQQAPLQSQQMPYGMDINAGQRMVNMVTPMNQINIKSPQFPDFSEQTRKALADGNNFAVLMGVPLDVSIVIGKTRRKIKEILEFGQGTVLELEKQTGAPAEIIVNGQLLAYGDVIVVGDNFGVRITEIVGTKNLMDSLDGSM